MLEPLSNSSVIDVTSLEAKSQIPESPKEISKKTNVLEKSGSKDGGFGKATADDSSAADSNSSSPVPPEPWTPKYTINFTDRVVKDGASVIFTIIVMHNGLTIQVLERIYEDFEYLEHCVTTDQPSEGLIIPPLPPKPTTDAAVSEMNSKKHMGKGSKTMLGDNFHKDRMQLKKYLDSLLAHPVLGKSNRLEAFLTAKEAPFRTKVKKGLFSKISDSLETKRTTVVPDVEEFFQKERAWITKTLPLVQAFDESFQEYIYSSHRLLLNLDSVINSLKLSSGTNCATVKSPVSKGVNRGQQLTQAITQFVGVCETVKTEGDDLTTSMETVNGGSINFWRRYLESEGNMLQTRTSLMINYQHANRALDKAKPNRKLPAEKAKKDAEESFERCSDAARLEIKRFHRVRSGELVQTVQNFSKVQRDYHTRVQAVMRAALENIRG